MIDMEDVWAKHDARLKRIDEQLDRDTIVYGTAAAILSIGSILFVVFWLGTMVDVLNFCP